MLRWCLRLKARLLHRAPRRRRSLRLHQQELRQRELLRNRRRKRNARRRIQQREQAEQTDEIEDDIDVVRNRNTPFGSVGVAFGGRAGDPGISRLIVRDVTPSGSATASNTVRFGIDVHSLTLTTGSPDGLSDAPFGTLGPGVRFAEQQASGYTAEMQISTDVAGFSVGTPPSEFLVKQWTGGLRLGRPNGAIRLMVVRDRVKDTMLSAAGAQDPGTGVVWGGVVSNTATLITGFDLSGRGAYRRWAARSCVARMWPTTGARKRPPASIGPSAPAARRRSPSVHPGTHSTTTRT